MPDSATDQRALMRFLARLGQAELAAGNAVALVERDLGLIAKRYGRADILVFAMPTVLMVQSDDGQEHRVQIARALPRGGAALRPDGGRAGDRP